MLGLNYRTAPVEIREKFSLGTEVIQEGLSHLDDNDNLQEMVVLSTCNRSEIYAVIDAEADVALVRQSWQSMCGMEITPEFMEKYGYTYTDAECIEHLLTVTASLDSLVLGEGQILSQVKHAYALALENGATDTILNLLFHCAISTGKRVRTETRIAFNAVSVSYAAVELAKNVLGSLEEAKVLLFGAGKMAELTAMHLLSQGDLQLLVANHHLDRAKTLAEKYHGEAVA